MQTPGGTEFGILGTKPPAPAPVLFLFAADVERTLTDSAYNRVATLLAERGFVCVSLDAPCHGKDNKENAANPLATWRTRIEKGDDLVGGFNAKCTQVLDYLVAEHYADPARVAAAGISRGGFLAVHWAAAEPRVALRGGVFSGDGTHGASRNSMVRRTRRACASSTCGARRTSSPTGRSGS
jgi:dienelactone hydrolase